MLDYVVYHKQLQLYKTRMSWFFKISLLLFCYIKVCNYTVHDQDD